MRRKLKLILHSDMIAALDLSLVCTFLYCESDCLSKAGQNHGASMAREEAELLRAVLARDYSKWPPMAGTQALIIQRFREGWPEEEREYDSV